jgi:predicted CoA-binding protein
MKPDSWRANLIDDPRGIREILSNTRRIAVLGIKPETHASQPAFYVPRYLQNAGFDVIPVPVYYPNVTTILGRPVVRNLRDVAGEVDIVNVFRQPWDIPQHVDDILALGPKVVWLQSGIRNDEVAERLARAGIRVVQDSCIMVEHRRG